MAKLIAKSAGSDLLPVKIEDLTMTEELVGRITSVAPFEGREKAVSEALKTETGCAFPAPNRMTSKGKNRIVWSGLGQAFVMGPTIDIAGAALTDQSDSWTVLALEGALARDALARLTPLDLRESQFKRGHVARSLLGHMNCLLIRAGADRYELMVFRSMTQTAVHELTRAMESVTAQL